jgi:hypothetical protein
MAESFTQVPPNSTGNKMRTRSRVIGADTVHEQGVFTAALPTYYALADAVAFAANKQHLSIFNNAGSNQIIAIKKLFHINLSLSAVTGVAVRFDVKKTTAQSVGTAITANSADSTNPALSGVQIATGATVTEGAILYPITTQNDEITAANTAIANYLMQFGNLALEGVEQQEYRLRPGEGMTIKQITSTTVGSFAWLMAFTVESTL